MNNDLAMDHNLGGKQRPEDNRDFPIGVVQAPVDHPAVFMQNVAAINIYNQQQTPSCGAHAGTWFRSYQKFVELGQPQQTQQFSPRSLWIEIKSDPASPDTNPDDGTDMRTIFKNLQTKGIADETLCTNDTWLSNAQYATGPLSAAAITNAKVNTIKSYAFLPSGFAFEDLKKAIYQNGAVILLIEVNAQMWTAPSGLSSWAEKDILPMRPPTAKYPIVSGHFIVAHSYDQNYVYFANSWSLSWGKNGHGYFGPEYMSQIVEGGIGLDLPLDLVNQLKKLAAPKFTAGQHVKVTKVVNVRSNGTTAGTVLGEQGIGGTGTIVNGPMVNNGYVWWEVNFDNGASGWCIELNLEASGNPVAVVVPAAPTVKQADPVRPVVVSSSAEGFIGRLLTFLGLNH